MPCYYVYEIVYENSCIIYSMHAIIICKLITVVAINAILKRYNYAKVKFDIPKI
jgi:hypothetical protein